MSAARRSLLTATAAGTLLGALWFVPSANATQDVPTPSTTAPASTPTVTATTRASAGPDGTGTRTLSGDDGPRTSSGDDGTRLADTGAVDTTPYLVGGTLFLALGAGFVTYSVRRERLIAY
ncbi:hypothetical protein CW362_39920 [Streptomyces populi]|uniref:Cell wall protein n=1 Tax=Streptomyces populi TaxID=2058924 RepID=A0A2I0SC82_9ACTN|nr:hypothetical protein [Streptomyces populi]PKT67536.1 hypothetical protein CW362_39920 [Streptomyces populi]